MTSELVSELAAQMKQSPLQSDTPQFRSWFGDSKVVDEKGEPLVVYHGTASDFYVFKPYTYFTSHQGQAADYANNQADAGGGSGRILPVYLSLKNPAIRDGDYVEEAGYDQTEIDSLISQGFDGMMNEAMTEIVVFNSSQIKYAIANDVAPILETTSPTIDLNAPTASPEAVSSEQYYVIERMIKRNERSLLTKELLDLRARYGPSPSVENEWFHAACHKNGAPVVGVLLAHGITTDSEAVLMEAQKRGHLATASAMSQCFERWSDLDPQQEKTNHPLLLAVKALDVSHLAAIFDKPCTLALEVEGVDLDEASKASHLLRLLSMQPFDEAKSELDLMPMAAYLVSRGADPNFEFQYGSLLNKHPPFFQAARCWNLPMMRVLEDLEAYPYFLADYNDIHRRRLVNAQSCLLFGIGKQVSKEAPDILPIQWEAIEYLMDIGIIQMPRSKGYVMGDYPDNISERDQQHIKSLVDAVELEVETTPPPVAAPPPRQRL